MAKRVVAVVVVAGLFAALASCSPTTPKIIFKHGELGLTTRFRVSGGIEYDHGGQYMALGPFDYTGP